MLMENVGENPQLLICIIHTKKHDKIINHKFLRICITKYGLESHSFSN